MATNSSAHMTATKRVGPPVPPRPQHANLTFSAKSIAAVTAAATPALLKAQRQQESMKMTGMTNQNNIAHTVHKVAMNASSTGSTSANDNSKNALLGESPVIPDKKANMETRINGGRTVIYKSSSMSLAQRPEPLKKGTYITTGATKPPLKLRKAPDVPPALKQRELNRIDGNDPSNNNAIDETKTLDGSIVSKIHVNITNALESNQIITQAENREQPNDVNNRNNIVIVHSSPQSTNRHNNYTSSSITGITLTRTESQKLGRLHVDQLKPSQPLPKPRKIVKMPVATLDLNEDNAKGPSTAYLLRRSKTTLDSLTSCGNVTTINTCTAAGVANGFLNGKTIEIKNNLKNAAERLFSEIIVSQQKQNTPNLPAPIITKHEPAIQHKAVLEQRELQHRQLESNCDRKIIVISTNSNQECTSTSTSPDSVIPKTVSDVSTFSKTARALDNESPKKKTAFHEILISEIAAMRAKSSSMENLYLNYSPPRATPEISSAAKNAHNPYTGTTVEYNDPNIEDVDADNIEDQECDEDELNKTLKNISINTTRKRYPSGCSSDSSPYGTERSTRIRTSDWIEVGDNGKEVTLTSCHISLEDSGLEDEERMDDMLSTSGVGDSWSCVKEADNKNRCQNMKRVMSFADLPPLPTSLNGINKILGSDSGLLSDVEHYNENNSEKITSFQQDNTMTNNNNNNNNNNSSSNNGMKSHDNATDKSAVHKNRTDTSEHNVNNNNDTINSLTTKQSPPGKVSSIEDSKLDVQLATLKKEMYGLRQLDLSLLSQLWALKDSLQEFRTMIEEQDEEDDAYSPQSPVPSSYDSVSSDGEDNCNKKKKHTLSATQIVTKQPRLTKYGTPDPNSPMHVDDPEFCAMGDNEASIDYHHHSHQQQQQPNQLQSQRPPLPKHLDVKPLPRMRTAPPPPPPAHRKSVAPPRPT